MKFVTHDAIIIEKNKLLVTLNDKDQFYKLPGGRSERGGSGAETCIRKVSEETGLDIEVTDELPVIRLNYDPITGKPTNLELHHYKAKLAKKQKNFTSYNYQDHEVLWISIEGIKSGSYNVSSNIKTLIENGAIK